MMSPCCCDACSVLFDTFNRANESLANVGVPPGTIFWTWFSSGSGTTSLTSNEAVIPTTSQLELQPDLTTGGVPRQFKLQCRFKVGDNEKTFRIRYRLVLNSVVENFIDLELVTSDGDDCTGIMRLLLDGVAVTDDVPVIGLHADAYHDVVLCYSGEQALLSATVTPDGEAAQSCHAKDVATTAGTALNTSEIWFVNVDSAENMYLDNVRLSRTKTLADGDYGDAELDCPCCGGGCQEGSDLFDDASIDTCKWDVAGFTWTEGAYSMGAGDDSAIYSSQDNAKLWWLPGSNGIDSDCLPDNTVRIHVQIASNDASNEVKVLIDKRPDNAAHYVKVKFADHADSGSITDQGAISIGEDGGAELASTAGSDGNLILGIKHDLYVCFDGTTIKAYVLGGPEVETTVTPYGGSGVGLGTGTINSGDAGFWNFEVNRNIYDAECADCITGIDGGCDDDELAVCQSDTIPERVLLKFVGDPALSECDDIEICEEVYSGSILLDYFATNELPFGFETNPCGDADPGPAQCFYHWSTTIDREEGGCVYGMLVPPTFAVIAVFIARYDDGYRLQATIFDYLASHFLAAVQFFESDVFSVEKPDCLTFDDIELTYRCNYSYNGDLFLCDLSGMTLKVSSR